MRYTTDLYDLCKAVCNIGRYIRWRVHSNYEPQYYRINAVTIYEGHIRYVTKDFEPIIDHPNISCIVDAPPEV